MDKGTRRQGDKEKEITYPLVSLSPCPLVFIPYCFFPENVPSPRLAKLTLPFIVLPSVVPA